MFDRNLGISLPGWTAIIGILLAFLGGLLVLLCAGVFIFIGRGTPASIDSPRKFVALGLYQYVRNPKYIGGLGLLIGFGLYEGSVSILIFSIVFTFLVHLFVVYYEEPTLKEKFGATYEAFGKIEPRWF